MARANKNDSKKRQKKHQLQKRFAATAPVARPSQTALEMLAAPGGAPAAAEAKPAPPTGPVEIWCHAFRRADGPVKLEMVRERLRAAEADLDQLDAYFPDALSALTETLSSEAYVELLEEVRRDYPSVFAADLDWNCYALSFRLVAQRQDESLLELMAQLAGQMQEIGSAFFPTVCLLRLAGHQPAAQLLIDAASCLNLRGLMPWARGDLIEWAMYVPYQNCVAAGLSEQALEETYQYSLQLGIPDSQPVRERQKRLAQHLAGQGQRWTAETLSQDEEELSERLYLLYVDYSRWLTTARGLPGSAADELRLLLSRTFAAAEGGSQLFGGFDYRSLERPVASYMHTVALDRVRGPALLLAVHLLYDFLSAQSLIDPQIKDRSQVTCRQLWLDLQKWMGNEWWKYRFLQEYYPPER